jgi:hypothetical protein
MAIQRSTGILLRMSRLNELPDSLKPGRTGPTGIADAGEIAAAAGRRFPSKIIDLRDSLLKDWL